MNNYEDKIVQYLTEQKTGDLSILSHFYDFCVELFELDEKTQNFTQNKRQIQYRLRKMKKKGLIDWRRTGSGFLGKTDFGMTSLNTYTLPNFWLH